MALSDGITEFIDDIKEKYPGIFVYSVQIPLDGSADDERKAGFVRIHPNVLTPRHTALTERVSGVMSKLRVIKDASNYQPYRSSLMGSANS